ncbi:MAG TPA: hypothetical protein VJ900_02110 [Patescibacteria group bacterium]|nr:hypothetical protein [Patescibacteria group bacterium]
MIKPNNQFGPGRRLGKGRGRQPKGFGLGPSGTCVCPSCGKEVEHKRGIPCYKRECPKCGTKMIRKK